MKSKPKEMDLTIKSVPELKDMLDRMNQSLSGLCEDCAPALNISMFIEDIEEELSNRGELL
jgi:hypothetical protein